MAHASWTRHYGPVAPVIMDPWHPSLWTRSYHTRPWPYSTTLGTPLPVVHSLGANRGVGLVEIGRGAHKRASIAVETTLKSIIQD